jgi:hypothetical protein
VQNLLIRLKSGIFMAFPEALPRKFNHNGQSRHNQTGAYFVHGTQLQAVPCGLGVALAPKRRIVVDWGASF